MGRHSKNKGDRAFISKDEFSSYNSAGSLSTRLGTDSQLPFGYCALSLHPVVDGVISPSGRLYSKEFILEYLLTRTKEIKQQQKDYDNQIAKLEVKEELKMIEDKNHKVKQFVESQSNIISNNSNSLVVNNNSSGNSEYWESRKRKIDDTDKETKLAELQRVSPWVPQFTPSAAPSLIKEPPKRPLSPFSNRALRVKDLMPIDLIRESPEEEDSKSGPTRYICPVSRKTITTQKVIYIGKLVVTC